MGEVPTGEGVDRFDFTYTPVKEMRVHHFYGVRFLDDHTNNIMAGANGKTHLAMAIAKQGVRSGRKAKFFNVFDLV